MIKALRVSMIVYAVLLILMSMVDLIAPDQITKLLGFENAAGYAKWLAAAGDASAVAAGIWIIVASRNPLQNINLLRFAITLPILLLVIDIQSVIRGYVDFNKMAPPIVFDAVFATLFLVLYPWRKASVK